MLSIFVCYSRLKNLQFWRFKRREKPNRWPEGLRRPFALCIWHTLTFRLFDCRSYPCVSHSTVHHRLFGWIDVIDKKALVRVSNLGSLLSLNSNRTAGLYKSFYEYCKSASRTKRKIDDAKFIDEFEVLAGFGLQTLEGNCRQKFRGRRARWT